MVGITITFQPEAGEFFSVMLGDEVTIERRTGIVPGSGVIAADTFSFEDAPELQPLLDELYAWRSALIRSDKLTWYME